MSTAVLLETAAPAFPSVDALLREVRAEGVRIPRPAEVSGYVERFSNLTQVIRKGCELAALEFIPDAVLSLELYVDPEIDDRYLSLYVRQAAYEPDVMERIERVQAEADACLDDSALDDSTGWFLITTDFQPPGENVYGL